MSKTSDRGFDCVQVMRRIREELSEEVNRLPSSKDRIQWIQSFQHSDPLLRRLQREAAQHAHPAVGGRKRA